MKLKNHLKNTAMAITVAGLTLVNTAAANAAAKVDPGLPDYQKTTGVSGNLSSVGSDTLANLMTLWAEGFKRFYPNVNIQIQAAGSSTAPPALTEGTSNIGPMKGRMKDKELASFEAKYGYKPTAVPVAIDALAVYVHKDNPIAGMSIQDIDAVFSSTRKCRGNVNVDTWGKAGLSGSWTNRDIQIFGRNSVSGTYGYFKNTVNEQPGSASVVQSVATSINGIGYSGIGYKTSSVRAVPLSKKPGGLFVAATSDNAVTGEYPLSRYLYVYVNKAPNQPLSPLDREFIKSVLSKAGQEVVVKDGYIPLPAKVVARQYSLLGL